MTTTNILVTGASGFIGSHAIEKLVDSGFAVTATSRSKPVILGDSKYKNVRFIAADLKDASTMKEALDGIDIVFHIGGLFDFFSSERELFAVNATGTDALCKLAREAGVSRFIYLSSGAIYGGGAPEQLFTETDPANPWDSYAKSKWAAEQAASSHHDADSFRVTLLRAGAVYGRGGAYGSAQALYLMKRGILFGIPGFRNPLSSHVHVEDCVEAMCYFAQAEEVAIQSVNSPNDLAYNLADTKPMTLRELLDLANELIPDKGLAKFHRIPIPAPLLKASAHVFEAFAKITKTRPLFEVDGIDFLTSGRAMDTTKLANTGFEPKYPTIHVGLGDTIEWYEQTGWSSFKK